MSDPQTTCPPPTAYEVPIRNVSLAGNISRRGASISIGTPGQSLAFQLNGQLNNTYVYDNLTHSVVGGCNANETTECTAQVGGLFEEDASSTWAQASDVARLVTAFENPSINPNHSADIWGTDILAITPQKTVDEYFMRISRGQGETMNTLGVGRNSTVLNALVDSGSIASRSWGFWQGLTGAESQYQLDGSLVLGGYDTDKVTGPNITLPTSAPDDLDANCYLITVTDVKMNLKNGSSPSLLGSSKATVARACVEPHFDKLSLSQDMWNAFLKLSGSNFVRRSTSVLSFYGMIVQADGAYDGDLTISLDPGLDITIPNHQLVLPEYDIDSEGKTYISDESNRVVLINSLEGVNKNDRWVLGLPFFSSAYMMVDNDRKQFTLWKSKATANSNIIANSAPGCHNATSAATPSSTSLAVPASSSSTAVSSIHHVPTSNGTIAGSVVGGLVGIALLLLGILFLFKRKRAKKHETASVESIVVRSPPKVPSLLKPELASDQQPPQEMASVRDPGSAVPPYEMSEGRSDQELPGQDSEVFTHEMPAARVIRKHYELPGLPSLKSS